MMHRQTLSHTCERKKTSEGCVYIPLNPYFIAQAQRQGHQFTESKTTMPGTIYLCLSICQLDKVCGHATSVKPPPKTHSFLWLPPLKAIQASWCFCGHVLRVHGRVVCFSEICKLVCPVDLAIKVIQVFLN